MGWYETSEDRAQGLVCYSVGRNSDGKVDTVEYRRLGHLAADGLFGVARVVVQHGDDFDDASTIADRSNFSRDGERLAAKDNVGLVREAGEDKKGKKVEVQNKSTLRRRKATPKEDDFW